MMKLFSTLIPSIAVSLLIGAGPSAAQAAPEHCNNGNVKSTLRAFYPGIFALNEFELDQNGMIAWTEIKNGGLGEGVAGCQYRLFASVSPELPDSATFCAHEPFLGGNQHSFPYKDAGAQGYLDTFYSHISGSYRKKAIAELSRLREEAILTRETYIDGNGVEQTVGDGGADDPALLDPAAGDPQVQDMIATSFRNFHDTHPGTVESVLLVQRQWAFIAELEAGRYWSVMRRHVDDVPVFDLPPVELNIVECD